jgi:hypothetical protein
MGPIENKDDGWPAMIGQEPATYYVNSDRVKGDVEGRRNTKCESERRRPSKEVRVIKAHFLAKTDLRHTVIFFNHAHPPGKFKRSII